MPAVLSGASCGRAAINSPHSETGEDAEEKKKPEEEQEQDEKKKKQVRKAFTYRQRRMQAAPVSQLLLQLISERGTVG